MFCSGQTGRVCNSHQFYSKIPPIDPLMVWFEFLMLKRKKRNNDILMITSEALHTISNNPNADGHHGPSSFYVDYSTCKGDDMGLESRKYPKE